MKAWILFKLNSSNMENLLGAVLFSCLLLHGNVESHGVFKNIAFDGDRRYNQYFDFNIPISIGIMCTCIGSNKSSVGFISCNGKWNSSTNYTNPIIAETRERKAEIKDWILNTKLDMSKMTFSTEHDYRSYTEKDGHDVSINSVLDFQSNTITGFAPCKIKEDSFKEKTSGESKTFKKKLFAFTKNNEVLFNSGDDLESHPKWLTDVLNMSIKRRREAMENFGSLAYYEACKGISREIDLSSNDDI